MEVEIIDNFKNTKIFTNKMKKVFLTILLMIAAIAVSLFVVKTQGLNFYSQKVYLQKAGFGNLISKENKKPDRPDPTKITIQTFGDLMLDRYVRKTINNHSSEYPFENIKDLLDQADFNVVNLEGTLTDFPTKSIQPNDTTFTFSKRHAETLRDLNFTITSLANNHSRDFGTTGAQQTKETLKTNNIAYFGDYFNKNEISHVENYSGTKIGFVGYHQLSNTGFQNVLNEVARLRDKVDFLIVYAHWGIEYARMNFSDAQQAAAYQLIEEGADAVVGMHPHVVQPIEIYKGKIIFYSLGNFVFDQLFSDDVREELGVRIIIEPKQVTYQFITLENIDIQIHETTADKRRELLREIAQASEISDFFKEQVKRGEVVLRETAFSNFIK